jgi:hypothetical protein
MISEDAGPLTPDARTHHPFEALGLSEGSR